MARYTNSIVVCKMPRAGLGNQLFPLMKAFTFAHLNNLECIVIGYHQLKIGPYLRNEKSKRKYLGYFNFQKGPAGEFLDRLKIFSRKILGHEVVAEPDVSKIALQENKIYHYSKIPHWSNPFDQLKQNRPLVLKLFREIMNQSIYQLVNTLRAPQIGVHIRMGDFRKLQDGEDFSKVGAVRTPQAYFIEVIEMINNINHRLNSFSIFTDGYKEELEQLLSMANVEIVEGNSDLVDLILLSRSKLIIASAGSTFSYWACFLSEVPTILHPNHVHERIREDDSKYFESWLDPQNPTLFHYIQTI